MALKKFLLIFLIINLVVNGQSPICKNFAIFKCYNFSCILVETTSSVNCHACSWSDGDTSTTNDCVTDPSKENSRVNLCLACETRTTTNMITGKNHSLNKII
jgi:hypothetical protein